MRDFKFRGWDKEEKIMYYDIYFSSFDGDYFKRGGFSWTDCGNNRLIIQQYTGLKDSDRKEIYEGDILESNLVGIPMVVKWYKNSAGFLLAWMEGHIITVIGNIYENPELIEKEK